MTASALNTASMTSAAGATGATGPGSAKAATGAAAGFDALLAALFPVGAQPPASDTPASPAATNAVAQALVPALTEDAEDAAPDELSAATPEVAGDDDAAAAMAAALAAQQSVTTPPAEAASARPPAEHTAPAWGRDKVKGTPAQPAIVNANPNADLPGKSELAPEAVDESPAPTGETPDAALTRAPAAASAPPPRSASLLPTPVASNMPTAVETAAQVDVAPPPPPVVAEDAAQAAAAAVQAEAPAAAKGAARPEVPVASPRASRADRKGGSEAEGRSDLKPLEAADKPVHAKAVDAAAKAATTSDDARPPETLDAETDVAAESPDATLAADAKAASQSAAPAAHTTHAVRGSPETVANLAAQIVKKLEGQSSRFDLELNPHGMGKVDVRIEIGAQGQLSAAMMFDNAQSAQELKARASELQRMLEQAGFDLSGGLSFNVADHGRQQGQAWQDQTDNGRAFRGQAFRAALETAGDADSAAQGALRLRRGVNAGLDVRI